MEKVQKAFNQKLEKLNVIYRQVTMFNHLRLYPF